MQSSRTDSAQVHLCLKLDVKVSGINGFLEALGRKEKIDSDMISLLDMPNVEYMPLTFALTYRSSHGTADYTEH